MPLPETDEDVFEYVHNYLPTRFSGPLFAKLMEGSKWSLVLQSDKPAPPFPFTIERYQSREWEWEIPWENGQVPWSGVTVS